MATPIQVCLFALVAAVNSQEITLDFLNQALGEPPPLDFNRPRYRFDGFGLNSNRLFDPQNIFNDRRFRPFGPQHGATATPWLTQNNVHTRPENNNFDSIKTSRQDRLPSPVTAIDEFGIKPEETVINTHNTASKLNENDEDSKIDKGPLKVNLLSKPVTKKEGLVTEKAEAITEKAESITDKAEPITEKLESTTEKVETITEKVEYVLKTNENKTSEAKPTAESLLSSSLEQKLESPLEPIHGNNSSSKNSQIVNITTTEKSLDSIVFPDQLEQIKTEMSEKLYINNKTNDSNILNGTSNYNEVNITKDMNSVLVPVQVISNVVPVTNMGLNTNSNNMLVPLVIDNGQVSQVLPITNDIFPMTTTEKINAGNVPIQGILYTNVLTILPQNSEVAMPIKLSDNTNNYQSYSSNALSTFPNNINPNVGIPSDIPKNPVIAMLLTPAKIQQVGIGSSNHLYNIQQQSNPESAASTSNNLQYNQPGPQIYTTLQNFAEQTIPNSQSNTQNTQYYLVSNNNNPVNGNNNNGQPMVLNLQGNLATNNPNVLSTDNTQKYMLVTVNNQDNLPQNTQGNIYTLGNNQQIQDTQGNIYALANNNMNSAQNSVLVNGGNNSQSNLYTLVTLPNAVQNAANNNLYVDNAVLNPGYQGQSTQGYSLVPMKDNKQKDQTK